jgi:hypothetical protein
LMFSKIAPTAAAGISTPLANASATAISRNGMLCEISGETPAFSSTPATPR